MKVDIRKTEEGSFMFHFTPMNKEDNKTIRQLVDFMEKHGNVGTISFQGVLTGTACHMFRIEKIYY